MDKIPVVWGLDKKYVLQAFVVMRSILMNSKEIYHFFLLTADDIEEDVQIYSSILNKEYDNFEISVRMIRLECFEGVRTCHEHLSVASYFRILIAELLPVYDRCIYLDCDIIVHGDLKELYAVELEDNYLAGVKDCHIIKDTPSHIEHQRVLGLPSRDKYINAGVLIMNLKKMRKDNLVSRFLEQAKKENLFEDQDVLNVCCYPAIKILPLQYNLFHFYLGKSIKFLYDLPYEKEEFDFDHENPYILHMGGIYKPWSSFLVKGSEEWWRIAEIFNSVESYHIYKEKCKGVEVYNEIRVMLDRARESNHIVVWGYGKNGRRICDILVENQLQNVRAIVDNNKALWGEDYHGIPVKGPEAVIEKYNGVFWIVSCMQAYTEIAGQLQMYGVRIKDIFHYINYYDQRTYLLSLQEGAYDREIAQIADMEYVCQIPDKEARKNYIEDIIQKPYAYADEYEYLAEKYSFRYWIQMLYPQNLQETEDENNCNNSLF